MLADKILFQRHIRLQVREVMLSDGVTPTDKPQPPADARANGSRGFYVRSLPVSVEQPVLSRRDGYLCYVPSQFQRYYIDLGMTFDEYGQKFSSKTRSTIKRKLKKYAEHCGGTIPWKVYRTPAELQEFFGLARTVSAKSYQEKLLDAGLPDTDEFKRDVLTMAADDNVRGYILFDGATPVSYLFCPIRNGVLLYQYLGYDPGYTTWSVGTVLQWVALENIFAEKRFRIFDYTEGQSEHKRLFGTHSARCANVMFVESSVSAAALIRAHIAMSDLSKHAGDLLDRYGLKSRIKKLIRFGRS
jgi:CelD/BcsL family acetyltransferase involved in cellulose biosynthesis